MSLADYKIRMLQFHTLWVHSLNFKKHCEEEWQKLTEEEKKKYHNDIGPKNHNNYDVIKT